MSAWEIYFFNIIWKKNIKIPFDIEGSDKFLWQFGVKIRIWIIYIGILIFKVDGKYQKTLNLRNLIILLKICF